MPRPVIIPEHLFIDIITKLITNILIKDINWETGHYFKYSSGDLRDVYKNKGKYILEQIESLKHLVNDNR